MHAFRHALSQHAADPVGAEIGALHLKEGNLVKWVDDTQRAAEFEAVENHQWLGEADMLGAEVAVAFHIMSLGDAPLQVFP